MSGQDEQLVPIAGGAGAEVAEVGGKGHARAPAGDRFVRSHPAPASARGEARRARRHGGLAGLGERTGEGAPPPAREAGRGGGRPHRPYTTDPGWTPLFVNAAAIVLEVGGVLQHGAVIAREYGKPCVAGIDRVASTLRDGERVEVDGTAVRVG